MSSEKKRKLKNRAKILFAIAVDQSIIGQPANQRINLKTGSDFFG